MKPFAQEKLAAIKKAIDQIAPQQTHPVAAFDADGTLWNTDLGEAFFSYQIEKKLLKGLPPDPWAHYENLKVQVSHEVAYIWLAQILKGIPLTQVRAWAKDCVASMGPLPVFSEMREIINHLHSRGVRVFVVTASIKWAVEPGALALGIAPERVIGITTKVRDGLVTTEQDGVITYRQGKVDGLLAATGGAKPFFCAGNTEGDLPLLESSSHLRLVVAGSAADNSNFATEKRMLALAHERDWYSHSYLS